MRRTPAFEQYYQDILNSNYSVKNWELKIKQGYEDLWAVGFSSDGKYLLTLTTSGNREIWSVSEAKVIITEEIENPFESIDEYHNVAKGFGPCAGEDIIMTANMNGGLNRVTSDGDELYVVNLVWPYEEVILVNFSKNGYSGCDKVCSIDSTSIGLGFNSSENAFLVAARDQLSVYIRK